MPSLPPIEEHEGAIIDRAGTGLGYITLIIGYLYTILSTAHLTPPNFLVFTALQICYSALLWWMLRVDWKSPMEWRPLLAIVLLVGITEVVGLLPRIGLQWDWLLFLVTIVIFFSILPLRIAVGAGIFLYLTAVVNLAWLNNWNWSSIYASLLSLLPAFAFVAIFSLVVRVLQDQKERDRKSTRLNSSH